MRYKLASNKVKKEACPKCGKKKHWQRYIDTETGEILPINYGRCDNEQKCGYWVKPDKFFLDQQDKKTSKKYTKIYEKPMKYYFDKYTYKLCAGTDKYAQNEFLQNLIKNVAFPLPQEEVYEVAKIYGIGTITRGDYAGGIAFPFADIDGNIHAVQVKTFDTKNHTKAVNFLHILLKNAYKTNAPEWLANYLKNESYVTCLFGEHLLKKYPNNPIGIVEAPKTAIYCALYFGLPKSETDLLWLATYNVSCFEKNRLKVLAKRKVFVFPDLSENGKTLEMWQKKALEASTYIPNAKFQVFDLLQKIAPNTDKKAGMDIADYIIQLDWKNIRAMADAKKQKSMAQSQAVPLSQEGKEKLQKIAEKQDKNIEQKKKRAEKNPITEIAKAVKVMGYYAMEKSEESEPLAMTVEQLYAEYVEHCQDWGCEIENLQTFKRAVLYIFDFDFEKNLVLLEKLPF